MDALLLCAWLIELRRMTQTGTLLYAMYAMGG